jgi:uncharacterized membrane protein
MLTKKEIEKIYALTRFRSDGDALTTHRLIQTIEEMAEALVKIKEMVRGKTTRWPIEKTANEYLERFEGK